MSDLVGIVQESWSDIFATRIGDKFRFGAEIQPQPQIMGFLLHELIPLNLEVKFPGAWRRGRASTECDAEFIPDDKFSFEIKTSSSATGIFGNRSYAHVSDDAAKRRSGYMLAVNFEKFGSRERPQLTLIRFGWLDPEDWRGQRAESGQQASLTTEAKAYKLQVLWPR